MEVLEWHGNSPDLNPIENLWSIVKNRLRKQGHTIKTKLIQSVIHVWFHDDKIKNIWKKLVLSIKKMSRFGSTGKRWTYQLLIAIKLKRAFFTSQIKAKCLKIVFFSIAQINLHKGVC